ncbi:hypothetical protein EGM85_11570 [Macrococcus caseolyticus]|nr:hypothetical protein [Macrococcus caseolyticus]RKO11187.1 hypothetical protein D6861_11570 [Macrococcus caseolyticus]
MSSLASAWSDLKETIFPSVAYAEEKEDDKSDEPQEKQADEDDSEDKSEEKSGDNAEENSEESEEAGDSEDDDEDEDDEDDEDEDEDELKDPLDTLREKYSNTVCHSFKHHFDECVERVTQQMEEPDYEDRDYKEDCVEEFFHLQHCLNDNIVPVLFSKLK